MSGPLPGIFTVGHGDWPKCPWCGQDVGAAKVTLQDLHDAHVDGHLDFAERSRLGAPEQGLKAECDSCGRPFLVALNETRRYGHSFRVTRVLAVRSEGDLKYLCGEYAW